MALYLGASFILDSPYCINTLFWRFWTKIEPDFEQNTIKDRNSRNYGLSYLL